MDIVSYYTPCFALVLAVSEPEPHVRPSDMDALTEALRLRQDLEQCLHRAERVVGSLSGPRAARQAGRFVAAWADERLLSSTWAGRRYWMSTPLQNIWGEGRSAGESFFQELASLHPQGAPNASAAPAVQVALRCLALGFVGQYHGQVEHLTAIHREAAQRFDLVRQPRRFPPLVKVFRPPLLRVCHAAVLALLLVACLWLGEEYLLGSRVRQILAPPMLEMGFSTEDSSQGEDS